MNKPELSVVMSVYNGEKHLNETIDSVLLQDDVDFEFIIVNDGSIDDSENIIRKKMNIDSRIILLNQSNLGLTKALIYGCNAAKGQYIARQDVGDISLAKRFQSQLDILNNHDNVSMVSSGVSFHGPENELVYQVSQSIEEAKHCLKPKDLNTIYGPPHHGSVMFNKHLYEKTGGYRKEFGVAQDLDLWTRLVEVGDHYSIQEVLYYARLESNSISSTLSDLQIQAKEIIIEMCRLRQNGEYDTKLLSNIGEKLNPHRQNKIKNKTSAGYYYFLASNLKNKNPRLAIKYFKKSVKENPFHYKAWLRLVSIFLKLN